MKRKLCWEAWRNPILDMIEEEEFDDNDFETNEYEKKVGGANLRLMSTPFGLYPVKAGGENANPLNFWIGHTNFNISKALRYNISRVRGVESLAIFSPYRFRIGVGKLFDAPEVKYMVQQSLGVVVDKPNAMTQEAIDNLSKYKHWAVLVLPNTNIDCCFSDKDDDNNYKNKLNSYRKASDGVGGTQLYTSE